MNGDKQYALVTGASSGIGLACSRELARLGYPLFLVSNEEEKLAAAAGEIRAEYHVDVVYLYMDLSRSDSAQTLFNFSAERGLKIEILINNAGIFFFGDVAAAESKRLETMINLHVLTPTLLSKLFAEQMMRENRKGYILNMASIAAWMPMPGIALYSSTKSYLYTFSRALHYETAGRGVSVTTVCPGAAATGLYRLAPKYLKPGTRFGIIMSPERLASLALKKMFQKKNVYIPGGLLNRFFIFAVRSLPDALVKYIKKKADGRISPV